VSRRGTARCVVSVEILPRNSAKTTCTTSPEQIEVIKLEGYSGTMLEGRMAVDSAASYVDRVGPAYRSSLTRSQLGP